MKFLLTIILAPSVLARRATDKETKKVESAAIKEAHKEIEANIAKLEVGETGKALEQDEQLKVDEETFADILIKHTYEDKDVRDDGAAGVKKLEVRVADEYFAVLLKKQEAGGKKISKKQEAELRKKVEEVVEKAIDDELKEEAKKLKAATPSSKPSLLI